MKKCYMVYRQVNGDCFPQAICVNRTDAEEICLSFAEDELYRRWLIDEHIAKPKGHKTVFTVENILKNMDYYVMEVPFFE